MKKLILLFTLFAFDANAYCYCTCQNGESVKVCTQPNESFVNPVICSPYC